MTPHSRNCVWINMAAHHCQSLRGFGVRRSKGSAQKFSLWESTVLKATRVKGLCITSLLLMTRGPEPQRCWHTVQATVSRNSDETLLYCYPARLYCMYYTVSQVSCTAPGKTVCILDSLCQGASHLLMFIINELRSSDNIIGCFQMLKLGAAMC